VAGFSTTWNAIYDLKIDTGDRLLKGYKTLNRSLADWALSIEDFFEKLVTAFRGFRG
jgi:hypothetical protein